MTIPKKAFNPVYLPYLNDKARILIFYGGASSGKSYFVAERYIYKLIQRKLCDLLVIRQVGRTNRDSTFALFRQVIDRWGLSPYFSVNTSDMRIRCKLSGNEIVFKGLDDPEKIKSITFPRGELTDIWCEEASEISETAFNQLSIRLRGGKSEKQIVLSFNPIDASHWLKHRFFDRASENVHILKTTYRDNSFLSPADASVLESYQNTDPYYYQVYCLGEWGVFGDSIFDTKKVNERLAQLRGISYKTGYFLFDRDGDSISKIRFFADKGGYITIYKEPQPCLPYVIGGDTSGDGSDYFVGQVLDNTTGEQVAVLRHPFDEDVYAEQIYCLAQYYNNALIGVEANYSTYPIKELQHLGANQYYREGVDTITSRPLKKYGFLTNAKTRPLLIANLVKHVRDAPQTLNDIPTLSEMLTFVRNQKGRPEASAGAHDDCVMALGIALEIGNQAARTALLPIQPVRNDVSDFLNYGGF